MCTVALTLDFPDQSPLIITLIFNADNGDSIKQTLKYLFLNL